jgi:hypothetical protein
MAGTGGNGASGGSGGGGSGTAAATLTVGSETWEFDEFLCAFDQPDSPFNASAFGEDSSGARVQLSVDIVTGFGDEIRSIQLADVENFSDPTVFWLSETSTIDELDGETMIEITGDEVSGTGLFIDQLSMMAEVEKIPGTLEATCTQTCSGAGCP